MANCVECGAQLPENAGFCPKCGTPADVGAVDPFDRRHLRREMRREMRGEWGRYWSPEYGLMRSVFAGLFVILLGGLLLACAWEATPLVTWSNFWAYLMIGAGCLVLLEYLLGFLAPGRAHRGYGAAIAGILLVALGAAGLSALYLNWTKPLWPLIIVAGGVLIIAVAIAAFLGKKPK